MNQEIRIGEKIVEMGEWATDTSVELNPQSADELNHVVDQLQLAWCSDNIATHTRKLSFGKVALVVKLFVLNSFAIAMLLATLAVLGGFDRYTELAISSHAALITVGIFGVAMLIGNFRLVVDFLSDREELREEIKATEYIIGMVKGENDYAYDLQNGVLR